MTDDPKNYGAAFRAFATETLWVLSDAEDEGDIAPDDPEDCAAPMNVSVGEARSVVWADNELSRLYAENERLTARVLELEAALERIEQADRCPAGARVLAMDSALRLARAALTGSDR